MKHKINPLRHHIEFRTDNILHITIETDRLLIHSITPENEQDCVALLADPVVMQKYATGVVYEEQRAKERMSIWTTRWARHDPFSAYVVTEKDSSTFVGIAVIGQSAKGESEVACAEHCEFWNKGYGREATEAVFQSLIPRLMLRGYTVEHAPLKNLVATARLDNPASQHMLRGVGFKEEGEIQKFGAPRKLFSLSARQLKNEYHRFFAQRSQRAHEETDRRSIEEGVDITAEEMADSAFGRGSYTARRVNS